MGSGLGSQVCVAGQVVEGRLVGAGRCPQRGWPRRAGVGEFGQSGAEQVVVGVGEQQGVLEADVGDLVAAGFRDALDEAVGAEASQVVGHLPGGDVLGCLSEEGRDQDAQVTVGEPVRKQPVDEQGLQERVHADVAKAQSGDASAVVADEGCGQVEECLGAADGVMADALDAEQASVGREADLP